MINNNKNNSYLGYEVRFRKYNDMIADAAFIAECIRNKHLHWAGDQSLAGRRLPHPHPALPSAAPSDLLWQRLRRQLTPRKEMLCLENRLLHGSGRGLVGRAHAHHGSHESPRRRKVFCRRIPLRLWQDQPCHDDAQSAWMEGAAHRMQSLWLYSS